MKKRAAKIGIIGGVGPSATILYYQGLVNGYTQRVGDQHFPEMVIHSLDLAEVTELFERDALDVLTEKLVRIIGLMERAGCDFGLFACNTMHLVFDRVQARVKLPLINLIDAVVRAVKAGGFSRIGLMGTVFAMRSGLYTDPLASSGVECLLPDESDRDMIMSAILNELQLSEPPEAKVKQLLGVVEYLKDRGAESILLGCTDLPAAVTGANSPLPVLDSAKIHVQAVLDRALAPNQGDYQ